MKHLRKKKKTQKNSVTHILAAVSEPEQQPVPSHCSGERPLSHLMDRTCLHSWIREVHGSKGQCLVTARVTKQRGALPRLSPKCHEQSWASVHDQFCSSVDQVSLAFFISNSLLVLPGPHHLRGGGSMPKHFLEH